MHHSLQSNDEDEELEEVCVGGEVVEREWHDPDQGTEGGDKALLEAVATLPLQRRVVVVLRYGLGFAPAAIASILDLPEGTVHSRLARALEQLREELEVNGVERA